MTKEDKPHLLKPSKTKPLPTRLIFLDTETDVRPLDNTRKVHKLKLGIAQDVHRIGERTLEVHSECIFTSKPEFFTWLDNLAKGKQSYYLIAHNIAYDAMILDAFRELPKMGFKMESMYSKGQVTIIRWERKGFRLIMLDNGNLFQGSLERWGTIFKIPKIAINFDKCTLEELTVYCRRDVEIMIRSWRVWFDFLLEHDCGGFRVTVGSTAFNTWRHKYMQASPYVHKYATVLSLEREAYHGGRVECFYQGKLTEETFYYLDINNMYGYVMRNNNYPIGIQGYSEKLSIQRMINYLLRYNVIARVTVDVDTPVFVTKVDGFTAYPLGRFDVTLTTNELILALQYGWLEKIHAMSWYKRERIFETFIDDFYKMRLAYREEGNTGFEQISKLLINSLYGKFGQTGLTQKVIGTAAYDEIWSIPVHNISNGVNSRQIALGGVVIEEFHQGESFHSMPAIAAHVTANARLYLFSLIQKAGWDNVFYTDTDSLIVNQSGYDNLSGHISENELGKLKVELASNDVEIYAAKEYRMGDRMRLKGIRPNAVEVSKGVYEQEQWPKLTGSIHAKMPDDYITHTIEKHQSRRVRSGLVSPSGWVEPFQLG